MHTHNELKDLLGVYALDAVEPDERTAVEQHLATCQECREEVDSHRMVTAALASASEPVPPDIWSRVEASLPRDAGSQPADVIPLRRPNRRITTITSIAAVTTFIAVVGVQTARIQSLQQELDDSSTTITALEDQLANGDFTKAVALAAARSDAQTVTLEGESGDAIAILLPDGTGYLISDSLTALESDRSYQLWAVQGGQVISAALLGSSPRAVPFRIDPASLEALVVTAEPAGGVVVSEQPAVAAWFSPGV